MRFQDDLQLVARRSKRRDYIRYILCFFAARLHFEDNLALGGKLALINKVPE